MASPGNRLLVGFLVFGFVVFAVGLLVREEAAVDYQVNASDTAEEDHPPLASRQLELVSTVWPPFTNAPGQPRFALDLVGEGLRRVGITAETYIVEEAGFASSLMSGDFDGSPAVWKYEEREPVLVYSQPYLWNRLILVGRQGSDVSAQSLADLAGKRIALVAGYVYGEAVEKAEGVIIVGSTGEEDSVDKLLKGEADYTLMDDLVVQYIVNDGDEARSRLAFGSTPLLTRSLHLAVHRSIPEAEAIISRFDAELRGMIADRTYHRLFHLDWLQADVDGDGRSEYVPRVDLTGPRQPERPYVLSATDSESATDAARRFYFDGNIFEGWSNVPERYKADSSPERRRTTVKIFTFTW